MLVFGEFLWVDLVVYLGEPNREGKRTLVLDGSRSSHWPRVLVPFFDEVQLNSNKRFIFT